MLTQRITNGFIISSSLMHIFCCGLPLIMSVTSLGTLIGITGTDLAHNPIFERFEATLIIVSGVMLALTALMQYVSKMIDCRTDGICSHKPCDKKKHTARNIFIGASLLYCVNLTLYFAHL